MGHKPAKMTRVEINRRSREKQEMVLQVMKALDRPVSVKEIAEFLPYAKGDTRNQFENLKLRHQIERVGKGKCGYLYIVKESGQANPYRNVKQEIREREGIWPEEITKTRKRVKAGDVFTYRDEEGYKRKTRVADASHRHICLFDNQQAYRWADVARCRRPGRGALGEWPK